MADLRTEWLGPRSPIVVSASPISRDPDAVAAAVESGAGAVVMHSLFEEQLVQEQMAAFRFLDSRTDLDAESSGPLPDTDVFPLDAEPYLRELGRLRERVDVPVLASLNGTTPGGWTGYARDLEAGGASALELNLYDVPTTAEETGAQAEDRQVEVAASVVASVKIPVTAKLSPFYASVPSFVRRLERAGVRGVTVFNRFYQPDIDLDLLDVDRRLLPSTPAELPLRLHALAILSPATTLSLGCTGGVHSGEDAAKAILAGAHVVQVATSLLTHGPRHVAAIRDRLEAWLDEKGYRSSAEARGVLDASTAPDPHAWARLNYARMLDGWRSRDDWRRLP
ncbi:MAG: dihydroorotate dehydrogenase-like protein [Alphaproteobacteria bacterium]